jgi:hypothetical protein
MQKNLSPTQKLNLKLNAQTIKIIFSISGDPFNHFNSHLPCGRNWDDSRAQYIGLLMYDQSIGLINVSPPIQ